MSHEQELLDLLEGTKSAETSPESNEDDSTVGVTQLYADPDDRPEGGSTESPWGEKGPSEGDRPNQAYHHSEGAYDNHKETRQGVLDSAFHSRAHADEADAALMRENFDHVSSGDFSAHSVHLQAKSEEKISHPLTVRQQVQGLLSEIE